MIKSGFVLRDKSNHNFVETVSPGQVKLCAYLRQAIIFSSRDRVMKCVSDYNLSLSRLNLSVEDVKDCPNLDPNSFPDPEDFYYED